MKQSTYTTTQIVGMLKEAEALLSSGKTVPEVCRHLKIGESTFYRWRAEYTGVKPDQVKLGNCATTWAKVSTPFSRRTMACSTASGSSQVTKRVEPKV